MITLWGHNNPTNVKKVLWTLEELELPYNQILAGGRYGGNRDTDYLVLNPGGLVPLLCGNETDVVLWESNIAIRYLTARYEQRRLRIDTPATRTVGEKWMDWTNQTLSSAHRVTLSGLVRMPVDRRDMTAIEASEQVCDDLFAVLDNALADQPWFSGAEFDTADIIVVPFIYNLFNAGLSWTSRPRLER